MGIGDVAAKAAEEVRNRNVANAMQESLDKVVKKFGEDLGDYVGSAFPGPRTVTDPKTGKTETQDIRRKVKEQIDKPAEAVKKPTQQELLDAYKTGKKALEYMNKDGIVPEDKRDQASKAGVRFDSKTGQVDLDQQIMAMAARGVDENLGTQGKDSGKGLPPAQQGPQGKAPSTVRQAGI